MKKQLRACIVVMLTVIVALLPTLSVSASQATSYTYTLDDTKMHYTNTQDAYLPDKTIVDMGLSSANDLFIDKNDTLFIADTGNKRIILYDINKDQVKDILSYEGFSQPKGIFVTEDGDLYVADTGAKMVFQFDKNLKLIQSFGKPDAPSFSDTNFEPSKIAVDGGGNMYIVGEGVYSGIIQLSHGGEFLGYFTVNKAPISPLRALQNKFFTRAQLAKLAQSDPRTFANIYVDDEGIVYTVSMGVVMNGLRKHNTSGGDIFKGDVYNAYADLTDIWVDPTGIIFTSALRGYTDVFTKNGELIFEFGSWTDGEDIIGLFSSQTAIAVDSKRRIWTVDGDKGYVQSFKPTQYAEMVFSAIELFEEGKYTEAKGQWEEVLRLNQMSVIAHEGVGKAYLYDQDYEKAMEHFEVSGDRTAYSDAYWEVRNAWLQKNLGAIIIILVVLYIISFVVKKVDKKHRVHYLKNSIKEKILGNRVVGDILYTTKTPFHPMDTYYEIRMGRKGTVLGASILYLLFFVTYMFSQIGNGFIFQFKDIEDMDMNAVIGGFFVIIILFVISNYLVTSIKDGDGSFKQVYMIPAYGCLPAMLCLLFKTIMSHFVTYNESFVLAFIMYIGIIWSIIVIFLGFETVHDYTTKENVISFLITFVFMIIAAVVAVIIIVMWEQLWDFIQSIVKEMIQNVL